MPGDTTNFGTIFCTPQLYQTLTDLRNYFTVSVRIRRKFVIVAITNNPIILKHVVTLLCKMSSILKAYGKHNDLQTTHL